MEAAAGLRRRWALASVAWRRREEAAAGLGRRWALASVPGGMTTKSGGSGGALASVAWRRRVEAAAGLGRHWALASVIAIRRSGTDMVIFEDQGDVWRCHNDLINVSVESVLRFVTCENTRAYKNQNCVKIILTGEKYSLT